MAGVAANDALFSSMVLAAAADVTDTLWKTHVHPDYVPLAVLTLLHAVRVSHGTRLISGGRSARLGLFQSVVLNQVVLFGAATVVALLLGIPMPIILSPFSVAVYSSVHVLLTTTGAGNALLAVHTHPVAGIALDVLVSTIDAVCRTEGIVNFGIAQVARHTHTGVAASIFARMVVGGAIGGALPLMVGLFGLNSPTGDWSLRTPSWLRKPSLLLLMQDLWAGAAVSLAYTWLTSSTESTHAKFPQLAAWLGMPGRSDALHQLATFALGHAFHPHVNAGKLPVQELVQRPYLSPREAKLAGTLLHFTLLVLPLLVARVATISRHMPRAAIAAGSNEKPVASPARASGVKAGTTAPRKRGRPKKNA